MENQYVAPYSSLFQSHMRFYTMGGGTALLTHPETRCDVEVKSNNVPHGGTHLDNQLHHINQHHYSYSSIAPTLPFFFVDMTFHPHGVQIRVIFPILLPPAHTTPHSLCRVVNFFAFTLFWWKQQDFNRQAYIYLYIYKMTQNKTKQKLQ